MKVKNLLGTLPELGRAKQTIFQDWNKEIVLVMDFGSKNKEIENTIFVTETQHETFKAYWMSKTDSLIHNETMTLVDEIKLKDFRQYFKVVRKEAISIKNKKLYNIYQAKMVIEEL